MNDPNSIEENRTKIARKYAASAHPAEAPFLSAVNARSDRLHVTVTRNDKISAAITKNRSSFPLADIAICDLELINVAEPNDKDKKAMSIGKLRNAFKTSIPRTSCSMNILNISLMIINDPGNPRSPSIPSPGFRQLKSGRLCETIRFENLTIRHLIVQAPGLKLRSEAP